MTQQPQASTKRFIGLDVHKKYLVAVGVDEKGATVLGPTTVQYANLENWLQRQLTDQDAVVLEMTTNAWSLYDDLLPHVASVTVVHPPQVGLITRARVKTDHKAALALAQLHAAGLLSPVWVPPPAIRQQRGLVAQRAKMVGLATQAKNRLHAVLHRLRLVPPANNLFAESQRQWWRDLPVTAVEQARIQADLATLTFAQQQTEHLTQALIDLAAQDQRVLLLIQISGIGPVTAMTILAAIGTIERFSRAKKLVGYAGLGVCVHDSGQKRTTGRITKTGRRDLRTAMIEAAHTAVIHHPHWRAELARLQPRLGYPKAIVAIARKLLVAVWHVLTKGVADRFAQPELVARKLVNYAHQLGRANRLPNQSVADYVREQLDRLQLGMDLTVIQLGKNQTMKLPPSRLRPSVV